MTRASPASAATRRAIMKSSPAAAGLPAVGWRRWFKPVAESLLGRAMTQPFRLERHLVHRGRTPSAVGLDFTTLEVEVEPGLRLRGWLIEPSTGEITESRRPRGTVVLLHGISSCKEAMLTHAGWFAGWGYRCLVFDGRGHGESGGRFCTFGYRERHDLVRCLDAAEARGDLAGPVSVYGVSLGGAVALQWMEIDPRVACGVVESTFASLPEIVASYQSRFLGRPNSGFVELALSGGTRLADFPARTIHPETVAARLRQPVLVIHGDADTNIPFAHGERVFRALSSAGSEWLPIPDGTHYGLAQAGGDRYREALRTFLDRHGSAPS